MEFSQDWLAQMLKSPFVANLCFAANICFVDEFIMT